MDRNLYIVIFAAVLPAFLLVLYIWLKDKYQREPLRYILRGMAYGVISAGLAYWLESLIGALGLIGEPRFFLGAIWNALIGAAIPEEFVKLLMLWLLLRNNPYFDERFDGIVYACCVGMGFAGTENILYLFGNIDMWQAVAVKRAIFAVPAHFMFAVAMGYFYSKIHFRDMNWAYRSLVYIAPVILHGIYDGILFSAEATPQVAGIILLAFYLFCFWMFRASRRSIQEQSRADDPNNLIFRV
jgi:RsiW-degrading membrane proteinase PrsW (M82 family)